MGSLCHLGCTHPLLAGVNKPRCWQGRTPRPIVMAAAAALVVRPEDDPIKTNVFVPLQLGLDDPQQVALALEGAGQRAEVPAHVQRVRERCVRNGAVVLHVGRGAIVVCNSNFQVSETESATNEVSLPYSLGLGR